MAHYAFINLDNQVVEVIVGIDENELIEGLDPETWYGDFKGLKCVRTSFNAKIRFNYAGIGYTYDVKNDAFIAPRPQCDHKELFLNHVFMWTCQACQQENAKLTDEA